MEQRVRPRYCLACGGTLATRRPRPDEPERQVCEQCGRIHYRNAKPSVSVLIVRDGRVLLLRRGTAPARGQWDLPGGFLEADEHPEAGAVREAREEVGLAITLTGLLGIYMGVYGSTSDPEHILNLVYLATAPRGEPCRSAEASELAWFAPGALPVALAFAHNQAALIDWHARQ
jgi:8-oxo-dGTP diphosphatase